MRDSRCCVQNPRATGGLDDANGVATAQSIFAEHEQHGELGATPIPPQALGNAPTAATPHTPFVVEQPRAPADPQVVQLALDKVNAAREQAEGKRTTLKELESEYRNMFNVDSIGASHGYQIYDPTNEPNASMQTRAIMQARVNTQAKISRIKRALQQVWSSRDDAELNLSKDKRPVTLTFLTPSPHRLAPFWLGFLIFTMCTAVASSFFAIQPASWQHAAPTSAS